MRIQFPKTVGDPVHGYIPLTKLEYNVLQLPTLNRLHYIRQNSLAFLAFPGSVTTRFSHVVGALHVGGKLVDQILSSMEKTNFAELFPEVPSPEFIVRSVRLACLLHDVGHGPFSHSAEEAMLNATKKTRQEEIDEAKELFNEEDEKRVPIHEFFSYKLTTKGEIADEIRKNDGNEDGDKLINSVSELLVKSDQGEFKSSNPNGYSILRKLVSSQLDADRMDYLVRDSMMSGVKFGLVDVDRIIKNMRIVKRERTYELVIHERALAAIEDMLDARYKMYRWFTMHHTVVVANELVKIAVDMMTGEDEQIERLFHWSSYKSGYSTDDYILSKIIERLNNNSSQEKYQVVRGLIDRRYMPISFFKSTPDFGRFVAEVSKKVKIHEDIDVTRGRIVRFLQSGAELAEILQDRLQRSGGNISRCVIYQSAPQIKTYEPFSDKDRVYLFRTERDRLSELWSESSYFRKINEEWTSNRGIYLFYLIPGLPKENFAQYKDELFKIMTEEIARV